MLFDFNCKKCNMMIERIVHENDVVVCPKCNKKMEKCFPGTFNFVLKYDPRKDKVSWRAEGYSETQRYREVKKKYPKRIF